MIFRAGNKILESEKERNLYTKFFAGYYLNELISGYSERVEKLSEYTSEKCGINIRLETPLVSFDNHAYLLVNDSDKGEFADILLHDMNSRIIIAIEAKYLSNWDGNNDLRNNIKRISLIKEKYPNYTLIFMLLVSKTKWEAVKKMKKHKNSNYIKYINEYAKNVAVLFWEDLVNFCSDDSVKNYMHYRLSLVNASKKLRYPKLGT